MASYRHLARIAVIQTLFAYEFRDGKIEPDLDSNCNEFSEKLKDFSFARELMSGILEKKKEIKKIIEKEAPEWPFERIALVDRVILEMGVYEILFSNDVPGVVAINESIEVAKVFGDTNSSKFVNGVLSTILNKYEAKKITNKKKTSKKKMVKKATKKTPSKTKVKK